MGINTAILLFLSFFIINSIELWDFYSRFRPLPPMDVARAVVLSYTPTGIVLIVIMCLLQPT